jgi:hypothetical protein
VSRPGGDTERTPAAPAAAAGGAPEAAAGPGGAHEPPPVLGSWSRLYGLVIGVLALEIALLSFLTWSCR